MQNSEEKIKVQQNLEQLSETSDQLSKSDEEEGPITIGEFCDLVEKEDQVHAQLLSNSKQLHSLPILKSM